MKVLIIEDEKPAAERLRKAILQYGKDIEVLPACSSVLAAVGWLRDNPAPDLIFMDVELSDGLSFRIFESVQLSCPVIFVTAYDEYWQEAFEYNSIDYLLKPIRPERLENALEKVQAAAAAFQSAGHYRQAFGGPFARPGAGQRVSGPFRAGRPYAGLAGAGTDGGLPATIPGEKRDGVDSDPGDGGCLLLFSL